MRRRRSLGLTVLVLLTVFVGACSSGDGPSERNGSAALAREVAGPVAPLDTTRRPILFLHGKLGSGDQFATQAQRFTSNGYPGNRIAAFDYDASDPSTPVDERLPQLDADIQRLLSAVGARDVDLVSQSEGAELAQKYLTSTPERASRVAHLVSLDGQQTFTAPTGVPTLVVWDGEDPTRRASGAENVRFLTEDRAGLAASAGAFQQTYRFLTGADPLTTAITPDPGPIELSGRALRYPANSPVDQARLEVYRVDRKTGRRLPGGLQAQLTTAADGSWGPIRGADPTAGYEFALVSPDEPVHHFYFQPFLRGDHLIRLLTSRPQEEIGGGMTLSARKTDLVVRRNQEWWGDQDGANDALTIDGTNVISANNVPRSKVATSLYIFDRALDGQSDVEARNRSYYAIGFITSVDLPIRAGDRSVEVVLTPRGRTDLRTVLAVPALPSTSDRLTLHFRNDP